MKYITFKPYLIICNYPSQVRLGKNVNYSRRLALVEGNTTRFFSDNNDYFILQLEVDKPIDISFVVYAFKVEDGLAGLPGLLHSVYATLTCVHAYFHSYQKSTNL